MIMVIINLVKYIAANSARNAIVLSSSSNIPSFASLSFIYLATRSEETLWKTVFSLITAQNGDLREKWLLQTF